MPNEIVWKDVCYIFKNTIQKIIKVSAPDVSVTKRDRVQQKHPKLQIQTQQQQLKVLKDFQVFSYPAKISFMMGILG